MSANILTDAGIAAIRVGMNGVNLWRPAIADPIDGGGRA